MPAMCQLGAVHSRLLNHKHPAHLACLGACPSLQAAGSAASRMKAQEVASTCWAWATLRYFPGAPTMDAMLAAAGGQGSMWQVVGGRRMAAFPSAML